MNSSNLKILGFSAIILFYLAVRLLNLTSGCLFFDEVFSVHAAQHDWGNLFWFVAQDLIHPPLFYVLLKIWINIGGESLVWLKVFPLTFSIIALIPFYFLCKNLKLNDWAIALALLLFAVNGCLIRYAQEVRMYSVFLCLGLCSLWLFTRFLNENKGVIWLILVNVLLVNIHYFGWLIVFSQFVAVLVLHREKLKQTILMIAVTGLSFIPWTIQIWQASKLNADFQQNLGWASKPNLLTIYHFVNDLFEPFYFQQTNIDRAETIFISAPLILICLIATVFYLINWKNETEKQSIILLLILLKMPIIIAFIASWILPVSVWGSRHLIIVFPLLAIYFGLVLEKIKIKELNITLISITILFVGFAFFIQIIRGQQKPIWCAWEELAQSLAVTEKTRIYTFEDQIGYHVWFNLKDKEKFEVIVVKGIEGLQEDKSYFLPRGFDEIKTINEQGIEGEKFYIVFRDSKFNELHPPLNILKSKGYKISEPKVFVAQGVQTFLVEIAK